jgi:hypothetical protein
MSMLAKPRATSRLTRRRPRVSSFCQPLCSAKSPDRKRECSLDAGHAGAYHEEYVSAVRYVQIKPGDACDDGVHVGDWITDDIEDGHEVLLARWPRRADERRLVRSIGHNASVRSSTGRERGASM